MTNEDRNNLWSFKTIISLFSSDHFVFFVARTQTSRGPVLVHNNHWAAIMNHTQYGVYTHDSNSDQDGALQRCILPSGGRDRITRWHHQCAVITRVVFRKDGPTFTKLWQSIINGAKQEHLTWRDRSVLLSFPSPPTNTLVMCGCHDIYDIIDRTCK